MLAVNAGSSSLKLTLLGDDDTLLGERELTAAGRDVGGRKSASSGWGVEEAELRSALDGGLGQADAVGHRIVHGGERFRKAVRIDGSGYVEAELRELVDLAPLHQPRSLAALDAVTAVLGDLPAVACFDTAFHATLPAVAATYAIPAQWRQRWGLRRYGFHGLSHAWVARRAPELVGRDGAGLRIVSCHLGAGASLCAIAGGHSIDTTMGFTPLEGLVMATRSGSVDPGMLLWLAEHEGLAPQELADALEHRSGLVGLCGTADMRELLGRVDSGDSRAELALGVYLHSLRSRIAAMAASLGGLDVLVFTGGVGENAARVRELAAAGLGFLGVEIDPALNRAIGAAGSSGSSGTSGTSGTSDTSRMPGAATGAQGQDREDADISAPDAAVATLVIPAREDREIARQVRSALAGRTVE